jgi:phosphohistidine phosphatase
MDLYLVRHAEAFPIGHEGIQEDRDRPLTELGKQQANNLAETFTKQGIATPLILTSPLVRAEETAAILAIKWKLPPESFVYCESLSPAGKRRHLAATINHHSPNAVALVGHEPDLGLLAAWLIGSKQARIAFAKGGAALIRVKEGEVKKGCGKLIWMVTPEWLPEEAKSEPAEVPKPKAKRRRKTK